MSPEIYKAARIRLSLTQAKLAAILGVPREAIVRREAGAQKLTREAELAIKAVELELDTKHV